jgi:hypothetical protein
MTVTEITTPAPAASGKHRAAVVSSLPPARKPSFAKLVAIELRKSVNTRSGQMLILGVLAIAIAALGWELTHLGSGPASFEGFLGTASTGVQLLLPVIGVMAMTSEWTQRTALTTFTLSPRRVPVQLAKFASAIVLSIVLLTVTTVLTLAATALGGVIGGDGASYAGMGGVLAGAYLTNALNVVMGAAFGAVIAQTAVAVLVYFVAPTVWTLAGHALFKDNAAWLDVFGAFGRIAERDLNGMLPETLTAIGVWILLPTVVGLWASSRREVK